MLLDNRGYVKLTSRIFFLFFGSKRIWSYIYDPTLSMWGRCWAQNVLSAHDVNLKCPLVFSGLRDRSNSMNYNWVLNQTKDTALNPSGLIKSELQFVLHCGIWLQLYTLLMSDDVYSVTLHISLPLLFSLPHLQMLHLTCSCAFILSDVP